MQQLKNFFCSMFPERKKSPCPKQALNAIFPKQLVPIVYDYVGFTQLQLEWLLPRFPRLAKEPEFPVFSGGLDAHGQKQLVWNIDCVEDDHTFFFRLYQNGDFRVLFGSFACQYFDSHLYSLEAMLDTNEFSIMFASRLVNMKQGDIEHCIRRTIQTKFHEAQRLKWKSR
jgi:hypothetical protein